MCSSMYSCYVCTEMFSFLEAKSSKFCLRLFTNPLFKPNAFDTTIQEVAVLGYFKEHNEKKI